MMFDAVAAVIALALGGLVGTVVWRALASTFGAAQVMSRPNYRGAVIPAAAGITVVIAVLPLAAAVELFAASGADVDGELLGAVRATSVAVLGFGLLGLLDDLIGVTSTKGFRGHLRALGRGEVTTGTVKLLGGVFVGVLVAALLGDPGGSGGLVDLVRQAAVVAGAANLGNLFDRAPGRTLKVSGLGLAGALVLAGVASAGVGPAAPAAVVGAGLALWRADLQERCMLGDTGANVLGGAVGVAWVVATDTAGEWVVLAVVGGATLLSERVPFSRIIDRSTVLRRLDRWGALPERRRDR